MTVTFIFSLIEQASTNLLHWKRLNQVCILLQHLLFKISCKIILHNDDTHFPKSDVQLHSSTYDSSIMLMDSDYPWPLSGGLRGLLLKYSSKHYQNLGPFNFRVPRARQFMLKAVFIRDRRFELCGKCLQMDEQVFYAQ